MAGIAGIFPCTGTASCVAISVKRQFLDQFNIKDTSQLSSGISSVFQKLLRYFNGTVNSISFALILTVVFAVILFLYSKDSEFLIGSTEISF